MCRYSAPPGYVRSKQPERPKLGPLVPLIDAILEADKTAPPKQRHRAKRIFERLRLEHRFAGGYTVVKDNVRIVRTRSREVFVPLAQEARPLGAAGLGKQSFPSRIDNRGLTTNRAAPQAENTIIEAERQFRRAQTRRHLGLTVQIGVRTADQPHGRSSAFHAKS
jgi:hypothetical protein